MSSSTSRVDHGGNGSDRRFLADGEVPGDGEGTNTFTKTRRIDLWHKLDQLRTEPSTTPAMADMVAWLCYAGDTSAVAVKQTAREEPGAHPEHVEAKSETGEATVTRDDVDSGHGGVKLVGDGDTTTAVGKTTKQQGIKHHSIEMKPKVHQSRATAH